MRKLNFGAGPATLPEHVLGQFCNDLIDFEESGVGIGELSHRTELFEKGVLEAANSNLAKLTGYGSEEWQVLWMTGGGTGQFAAVPMNFDFSHGFIAVYLVTGCWSEKAAEEAKKLVGAERVAVIDLRVKRGNMSSLREPEEWIEEIKEIKEEINYVYYCDNETVDGIEIPEADYFQDLLIDKINSSAVFVADTSSNFLSRELPKSEGRTGLVFAGVQKNLGAAGVTVVLIKKSVLATKIKARHW
jgi:phosphoserine aminotransferase